MTAVPASNALRRVTWRAMSSIPRAASTTAASSHVGSEYRKNAVSRTPGTDGQQVDDGREPEGAQQADGDPSPESDPEQPLASTDQADQSGGDDRDRQEASDASPEVRDRIRAAGLREEPEDGSQRVGEDQLGESGGRERRGGELSRMATDVAVGEVVGEGHDQRGGQGGRAEEATGQPGEGSPPDVAARAGQAERGPPGHEQPVEQGRLGKAGQDGEGQGHGQQPPSPSPAFPGRLDGPLHPDEGQREQGNRPYGGVRQPGERPAQAERHPRGSGERPAHPEPANQEVGRPPGHRFDDHLHDEHTLVKGQEHGQGEERPALHLPGQGGAHSFIWDSTRGRDRAASRRPPGDRGPAW